MENKSREESGFSYTYSAREQMELRRIREKYAHPNEIEDKMKRLRRLDASVTQTAQAAALALGLIGALVLGFGMSLCLTELGEFFGMQSGISMAVGVIVGIIGGVLTSLAYPTYHAIEKARRQRLAPEIIRLTDELMK